MADYIERGDAFDAVMGQFCDCSEETEAALNGAIEDIRKIPAADVVEVVRCKDCVHYDKGKNDSESWEYCKVLAKDVYDDFYCKLGKRLEAQDEV